MSKTKHRKEHWLVAKYRRENEEKRLREALAKARTEARDESLVLEKLARLREQEISFDAERSLTRECTLRLVVQWRKIAPLDREAIIHAMRLDAASYRDECEPELAKAHEIASAILEALAS